jgi:ankyrin repeat protein
MGASGVFISYRREDSAGHAGRLFDHLAKKLGRDHVFRDVDNIRPGDNFAEAIREKITASELLLVLIGPGWLTAVDREARRRLEDPHDVVRLEIEMGLKRKMRIIPVLLPGVSMPSANELPESLAPLHQLNAFEISEAHFDRDVLELIAVAKRGRGLGVLQKVTSRPIYLLALGVLITTSIVLSALWLRQHFRKKIENATSATPGIPSPAPTGPVITPEEARLRLALMHLSYDAHSFANSARQGDALAVSLFLRAGMNPDETPGSYTPFELAVEEGHFEVAKSLIQGGANVDRALPWVAQKGNRELFQLLLSKKPGPEALARALCQAAEHGHLDLVQELVATGVDVNARGAGGVALAGAAYSGRIDVVKYLLGRGAEVNAVDRNTGGMGETPLLYASRSNAENSFEIVALLLKTGASVNAQDQRGATALMNALDHPDIVSLLLANGADVNVRTKSQATALMYAAGRHRAEVIKLLADKGADVNAQDATGLTPLMYTTGAIDSVDDPKTVRAVLGNGGNANQRDLKGGTALMFAAGAGLEGATRVLIRGGADPSMRNNDGQTAQQLATLNRHKEVAQLLASHGNE